MQDFAAECLQLYHTEHVVLLFVAKYSEMTKHQDTMKYGGSKLVKGFQNFILIVLEVLE